MQAGSERGQHAFIWKCGNAADDSVAVEVDDHVVSFPYLIVASGSSEIRSRFPCKSPGIVGPTSQKKARVGHAGIDPAQTFEDLVAGSFAYFHERKVNLFGREPRRRGSAYSWNDELA